MKKKTVKQSNRCGWGQTFASAVAYSPWGLMTFTWSFLLLRLRHSLHSNAKHVTELEWIWKGKSVLLRKRKSLHSHQCWSIQYTRIAQAAWRLLYTLQSRWTSFKVQRAQGLLSTSPMGVWKTGEVEVHFTLTLTQFNEPKRRCGLECFGCSTWGLSSWSGRGPPDVGVLITGLSFRVWNSVECAKQSVWECAAGLKKQKSIVSLLLIKTCVCCVTILNNQPGNSGLCNYLIRMTLMKLFSKVKLYHARAAWNLPWAKHGG